jgi:hypothetical protein
MRVLALAVAVAALAFAFAPRAIERRAPVEPDRFAGAHLPDATVKIARLSSGAVAAVADRVPARDRSWGASLLFAAHTTEGARDPVELCDRVFHASRPLVLPTGELAVERGRAGPELPGRIRVDELTVDAVDPKSGAARTLYATTGFEAHLAAVAGNELVVYLVQPDATSLRAIDVTSGRERIVVPSLPPWAHDFSIENGALLVHNRDDVRHELQTIERIDLSNGNRTRVDTFE